MRKFHRLNAPLQFFLVFATMFVATVLYAGNWIPYGHKTIMYGAVSGIIMLFGSNAARASYEKANYYPKTKTQLVVVAILALTFIIAAVVKHYELTQ